MSAKKLPVKRVVRSHFWDLPQWNRMITMSKKSGLRVNEWLRRLVYKGMESEMAEEKNRDQATAKSK